MPTDGLQLPVPSFSALARQIGEVRCLLHCNVLPISYLMLFFNQHSQMHIGWYTATFQFHLCSQTCLLMSAFVHNCHSCWIPRVSIQVWTDQLLYSRLPLYSLLTAQHVVYVPSKAEPADEEERKEHILGPIPRPLAAQRPNVTGLPGIRSHFSFRVKDEHTIYMRAQLMPL